MYGNLYSTSIQLPVDSLVAGDTTLDFSTSNYKIKTLNKSDTLNIVNAPVGKSVTVVVHNDSTWTLTWTSAIPIKWQNGTAPIQTTGSYLTTVTDIYIFLRIGYYIYGTQAANYY